MLVLNLVFVIGRVIVYNVAQFIIENMVIEQSQTAISELSLFNVLSMLSLPCPFTVLPIQICPVLAPKSISLLLMIN